MTFHIPGPPVPKARPRVVNGHAYTPQRTTDYEQLVRSAYRLTARSHLPLDKPCAVEMVFRFPIPASARRKTMPDKIKAGDPYPHKPDADNLVKAIMDGLIGFAFTDDALVVSLTARKEYGEPGAEVTIREATP